MLPDVDLYEAVRQNLMRSIASEGSNGLVDLHLSDVALVRVLRHHNADMVGVKHMKRQIQADYPGYHISCKRVRHALQSFGASGCQDHVEQRGGVGTGDSGRTSEIDKAWKELPHEGGFRIFQHRKHSNLEVPIDFNLNDHARRQQLRRKEQEFEGTKPQRKKRPAKANVDKPPSAKEQRLKPAFRQRCWSRPNETEAARRDRIRAEAGSRTERLQADRQRDLQVSSSQQELCAKRGISRSQLWPPRAANGASPSTHLNRCAYAIRASA